MTPAGAEHGTVDVVEIRPDERNRVGLPYHRMSKHIRFNVMEDIMSSTSPVHFSIAGQTIASQGKRGQESVSLTDLFKAAGSPPNKDPGQWLRLPDTLDFLDFQTKTLNMGKSHIIQASKGRRGSTWGHWVVALEYAAYLSKQVEDELIRAWRQLREEERDPDLAADMSFQRVKNYYLRQGHSESESDELAARRLIGKAHRNLLTSEWQRRGAQQPDFATLTNAGYLGMYKKTAREIRQDRGLPAKTNLRNHMGLVELAQTGFHEALTREQLRQQNVYGVQEMAQVSHATGKELAHAIEAIQTQRLPPDARTSHTPRTDVTPSSGPRASVS